VTTPKGRGHHILPEMYQNLATISVTFANWEGHQPLAAIGLDLVDG